MLHFFEQNDGMFGFAIFLFAFVIGNIKK